MTKENSLTWVNLSKFPDLFKSTLTIPRKVAWFLNTHRSTQYICMKVPLLSIDLKYCWWIEKISPVVIKLNMRICFSTVVNANQRLQSAFLSRHSPPPNPNLNESPRVASWVWILFFKKYISHFGDSDKLTECSVSYKLKWYIHHIERWIFTCSLI